MGERKDENKATKRLKETRYKRRHGLCTSREKMASLSTYSFQTPLPHTVR